jgi:hypothetical protein
MNDILFGNFQIVSTLKEGEIFRWVKAKDCSTEKIFFLQLLVADATSDQVDALLEFFFEMDSRLFVPQNIISDSSVPFCAVYEKIDINFIKKSDMPDRKESLTWWKQISEQLFIIHNSKTTHGCVSPEDLVRVGQKIYLVNFGYHPLISLKNTAVVEQLGAFTAGEVVKDQSLTSYADVFSFAKTVAYFYPEIENSAWYRDATAEKAEDRPRRMRNLFDDLKKTFDAIDEQKDEKEAIEKELQEEKNKTNDSNIVPMFSLVASVDPVEGGHIDGAGNYMIDKKANLLAKPAEGFLFDHWEGDLSCREPSVAVDMDYNKQITAVFIKDPDYVISEQENIRNENYRMELTANPDEGGSVTGSGTFPDEETAIIRAIASAGFKFEKWEGDFKSENNPAFVKMDCDKKIIAIFSRGEMISLETKVEPSFAGIIRGKQQYVKGSRVKLYAVNKLLDWGFEKWGGDIEGSSNPLNLLMDSPKTIIAHFKKKIWANTCLMVHLDPPEGGKIKGVRKCARGQILHVEAIPNPGWKFVRWSGIVNTSSSNIQITMDKNKELYAHFKKVISNKDDSKNTPKWIVSQSLEPQQSSSKSSAENISNPEKMVEEKSKPKKKKYVDASILSAAFQSESYKK